METKDPALTKTPIKDSNVHEDVARKDVANEKVIDSTDKDPSAASSSRKDAGALGKGDAQFHESNKEIEENTTVQKGTDTFEEDVIDSEHVKDGDNPARQPDRRDQEGGTPFDGGVNEDTMGSEKEKSDEITDMNRYASVNNAQKRTLTPDEED